MSENNAVPAATWLAARRGFIRTTSQAYAAAIPVGGINVAGLAALTDLDTTALVLTAAAWLGSPLLAGVASFLSIVGSGVPDEYASAVPFSDRP